MISMKNQEMWNLVAHCKSKSAHLNFAPYAILATIHPHSYSTSSPLMITRTPTFRVLSLQFLMKCSSFRLQPVTTVSRSRIQYLPSIPNRHFRPLVRHFQLSHPNRSHRWYHIPMLLHPKIVIRRIFLHSNLDHIRRC